MNRLLLLFAAACALPFVNRFQEITIRRAGVSIFEEKIHYQANPMILVALIGLGCLVALFCSIRSRRGSIWQALRFGPAVFALPLLWHNWTISRFGGAEWTTEIKRGMGGPMAGSFFIVAAVTFVVVNAYLLERDRGTGPS